MAKYVKIYDKLNGQPHLQDLIKHQYYSVLDAEDKKIYEEHHKKNAEINILNLNALIHLWSNHTDITELDFYSFDEYFYEICSEFKYDCYHMYDYDDARYMDKQLNIRPMGDYPDRRLEMEKNN